MWVSDCMNKELSNYVKSIVTLGQQEWWKSYIEQLCFNK